MMNSSSNFQITLGFLLFILLGNNILAQETRDNNLDDAEIFFLINSIADSLTYYYVDAEDGIRIGNHLKMKLENGSYKNISSPDQFAEFLTKDLRSVNGDLHLYIKYHSNLKEQNEETPFPDEYGISSNYGFQEIKIIEGNIAYLRITHFSNWSYAGKARQKITEVMNLLKNSKAFIIDLRDNRGGVPFIASFLSSYFFSDKPIHLADFYTRFNDSKYGIYTEPFVPGIKHSEKPLFILVNNKSASAAEEFAFWMQNHKRAIIIGESTAGAGYGAMNHKLNERFSISISSEEEIDPVTKRGFQGTGVVPDIVISDSSSFLNAVTLAKKAIEVQKPQDSIRLNRLLNFLEDKNQLVNEAELFQEVLLLNQLGLLNYDNIYELGNKYINEPKKAIPILKVNTIQYSYYPNPFEDYAKALTIVKDYESALINYDKAVKLAEIKNNPNLKQFKSNRDEFVEKYKFARKGNE